MNKVVYYNHREGKGRNKSPDLKIEWEQKLSQIYYFKGGFSYENYKERLYTY